MESEREGQAEREGDRDRFIHIYGSQGPNICDSFVIIYIALPPNFRSDM